MINNSVKYTYVLNNTWRIGKHIPGKNKIYLFANVVGKFVASENEDTSFHLHLSACVLNVINAEFLFCI